MFQFLNNNSGSIIATLTFILAIITGVYAFLTWRMVKETKRMREIQSEPNISIYFKSKDEYISLIDLVIKNIGQGPAFKISLRVDPDFKYRDQKNISELNLFKKGIHHLAPGQQIEFFLNSLVGMIDKKLCMNFDITVNYQNATGKEFQRTYNIDLSEIIGLRRVGDPPLKKISDQLEKMKEAMEKMYSYYPQLKVIAYTKKDIDEETERMEKFIEEEEKEKKN